MTNLARRLAFLALVGLSTWTATTMMAMVLQSHWDSLLDLAILALFAVNFGLIVTSFWTAVLGVAVRLVGGDPASLAAAGDRPLMLRHALVMPIYNEDTARVFAGLEVTWASLQATGRGQAFDLFVLSDTTRPEIAAAEEQAWAWLVERTGGQGRIFYRRRQRNSGRKAGNIADFCRQWGALYETMTVLDADSVMAGATIVKLAQLVEAHADVGIVQTVPVPVNRHTLFARMIQFANRLYSPILASGMSFWQRGEANYWGHNAIIRLEPFVAECGLPALPGAAPLGGEILSHDFVEAALMRRAGWRVWMVPELDGSYEEVPANVIDFASRDRRWAQGNLQHMQLLTLRGLHPVSRVHLVMGVLAYLSSPLWLLMLVLSTTDVVDTALRGPIYFPPGFTLFPTWPVSRVHEIVMLALVTAGVIFGPKLLGVAMALARRTDRRAFGGAGRLLASAGLEILFSTLLAPSMMLFHTSFVTSTLLGRSVRWEAQPRDDRGLSLREAVARLGLHTAIGLVWAGVVAAAAPDYLWWLAPILLGLIVAVPFALMSSRTDIGHALRRRGLLLAPEESAPPPVLAALRRRLNAANDTGAAPPLLDAPRVPEPRPQAMLAQELDRWGRRRPAPARDAG